jgi:hypothetical protein
MQVPTPNTMKGRAPCCSGCLRGQARNQIPPCWSPQTRQPTRLLAAASLVPTPTQVLPPPPVQAPPPAQAPFPPTLLLHHPCPSRACAWGTKGHPALTTPWPLTPTNTTSVSFNTLGTTQACPPAARTPTLTQISLTDLFMTRSNRVKKKSVQEHEHELAQLCRKNNIDALSNREWSAPMSLDPSPPRVPTRVPTVTRSKLKHTLSPQKKPDGGGGGSGRS